MIELNKEILEQERIIANNILLEFQKVKLIFEKKLLARNTWKFDVSGYIWLTYLGPNSDWYDVFPSNNYSEITITNSIFLEQRENKNTKINEINLRFEKIDDNDFLNNDEFLKFVQDHSIKIDQKSLQNVVKYHEDNLNWIRKIAGEVIYG